MRMFRGIMLIFLGLGLTACGTADVATRNAPFEPLPAGLPATPDGYVQTAPQPAEAAPLVNVVAVEVEVPRSLQVSEANRYLPRGDIVWREDPAGDRHAQVQAIVQAAMEQGAAALNGPVPVVLQVRVARFHALTEKARYTTGGVHSITFDLALTDPETGELLVPVRQVRADLDAYGGQKALQAEAAGQTQKVRITAHLAKVIRQELTSAEGYKNANLGFMQLLNNI